MAIRYKNRHFYPRTLLRLAGRAGLCGLAGAGGYGLGYGIGHYTGFHEEFANYLVPIKPPKGSPPGTRPLPPIWRRPWEVIWPFLTAPLGPIGL